jgi:hypothetical protein
MSLPDIRTGPGRPGLRVDGKSWGAEGEQIEDHRFIVSTPVIGQKTALGLPTVTDLCRAHHHPGPLNAAVESVGQVTDLRFGGVILIEILLDVEHSS